MKRLLISLGLLLPCIGFTQSAIESRYKPFIVYELKANDSLNEIIRVFWNETNGVHELLQYNLIENENELGASDHIVIPIRVRRIAMVAIEAAEASLSRAREAAAPEYAEKEYRWADRLIRGAKTSREAAAYDQAEARAVLAGVWADKAKGLAEELAVIQEDAHLRVVFGKVQWRGPEAGAWQSAEKGQVLKVGCRVRTLESSRAEIELADGSLIQMMALSECEIEDQSIDRRNGARGTALKVKLGGILGKIKPKGKESKFKINSHTSAIGIRGTELKVSAGRDMVSRLSVLQGDTELTAGGKSEQIRTDFGSYVKLNEPPVKPIRLLPPPTVIKPAQKIVNTARQTLEFTWNRPPAAVPPTCRFELAEDDAFNRIVENKVVAQEIHTTPVLDKGVYFWRLCSIDSNGSEGPFSEVNRLTITPDLGVKVAVRTHVLKRGEQWIVGPMARFAPEPESEDTSVAFFEVDLDGEGFKVSPESFPLTGSGSRTISVRGVGLDKKRGAAFVMKARLDDEPPKPLADLTFHPEAETAEDKMRLILTSTDNTEVERIEYSLNGLDFEPYLTPVSVGHLGARDIRFRAVDAVGNVSRDYVMHLMGAF